MIYKLFTDEETDSILAKLNKNFIDGKNSQKLSNVYSIKENKETLITPKIDEYIGNIFKNKKAIKKIYAPTKIKNRIYNNYNTNDFYDYHVDSFQSSDSKMLYNYGFTISLSDDYEGGEFVFNTNHKVKLKTGDLLIFPSNFLYAHEVKEITKGNRYSYVSWAF